MSPDLKPGITFEWMYVVPPRATVPNLYADVPGCVDMPDVLATGYLVGILECACVQMLLDYLDYPHEQSLGTMVHFTHVAATPPGMAVRVKGRLDRIDGRRLYFSLSAWDGEEKISEGVHERTVVDSQRFRDAIEAKRLRMAT